MVGLKLAVGCVAILAAACAGDPAAASGAPSGRGIVRTIAALEQVFAPMKQPLSVAADRLVVDVSRELWDRFGYPAHGPRHSMKRTPGSPTVYRFENVGGGLSLPLKFVIGKQTYLIVKSALFRIHREGPARLKLVASGSVVVQRPGVGPKSVAYLAVEHGQWIENP